MKKNNPFRILWIALGFLCLGLGSIGILLPILPTVPFYLAKSSKRLHDWFIGTGLYKRHLESFVQKKSMSMRSKLSIVGTVTVIMAAGFFMMSNVPAGRICLAVVWVCHLYYFFFRVKTLRPEEV
jgi:uncharacterized membrane protein YbaN (DUF454 family)